MQVLHSSLRCRNVSDTIKIGQAYAKEYGISRLTNITRLDNIGIPVYVSIRPDASEGSLCVNAGKGITNMEAKAGALMEGIELAVVEPHRKKVPIFKATYSEVLDSAERPEAILDFCPTMGAEIPLDEEFDCVHALDLFSGKKFVIPAELAYCPYTEQSGRFFGTSSNGLASGNSIAEASIHGIFEVIERDITSFQTLRLDVSNVDSGSMPKAAQEIYEKVLKAGHDIQVWYAHNEFDIPQFMAVIIEGNAETPMFIHMGFGCHGMKSIALIRAITEAAQGRLSYIHGGRDDLRTDFDFFHTLSEKEKYNWYKDLAASIQRVSAKKTIDFEKIHQLNFSFETIEEYFAALLDFIRKQGFRHVLQVPFTSEEEPLQVVKMIIPRMEFFSDKFPKIGHRLKDYGYKIANGHFRGA